MKLLPKAWAKASFVDVATRFLIFTGTLMLWIFILLGLILLTKELGS